MDETLHQLAGILLRAVPTFILVVLLHFYLKFMFFGPLAKVLRERHEATEGARKAAEAKLAMASEKTAEYEAALRAARAETYKELEEMRRKLQEERTARLHESRARAEAAIAAAKAELHAEAEKLKKNLEAESDALADSIADRILRGRAA
jgi:F-type H+-transporting ATPase subunit b